jgi:hypothetical protein
VLWEKWERCVMGF